MKTRVARSFIAALLLVPASGCATILGDYEACEEGSPALRDDPKNCGKCGRDCLGGACRAGVCEPFAIAEDQDQPTTLALTEDHVYWTTVTGPSGAVKRARKDGSDAATVAAQQDTLNTHDLAVANGNVYWTNGPLVMRATVEGNDVGAIFVRPHGATNPSHVAAHDRFVYAAYYASNVNRGAIVRIDANKGESDVIFFSSTGRAIQQMALDPDRGDLYWSDSNGVQGAQIRSLSGVLGATSFTTGLSVSDGFLLWTTAATSHEPGSLYRRELAGKGRQQLLADGLSAPYFPVADGESTYWVDWDTHKIKRLDASGDGRPEDFANVAGERERFRVAVDETSVYWTSPADGKIYRQVK
jgi:hypothetical protein